MWRLRMRRSARSSVSCRPNAALCGRTETDWVPVSRARPYAEPLTLALHSNRQRSRQTRSDARAGAHPYLFAAGGEDRPVPAAPPIAAPLAAPSPASENRTDRRACTGANRDLRGILAFRRLGLVREQRCCDVMRSPPWFSVSKRYATRARPLTR